MDATSRHAKAVDWDVKYQLKQTKLESVSDGSIHSYAELRCHPHSRVHIPIPVTISHTGLYQDTDDTTIERIDSYTAFPFPFIWDKVK